MQKKGERERIGGGGGLKRKGRWKRVLGEVEEEEKGIRSGK